MMSYNQCFSSFSIAFSDLLLVLLLFGGTEATLAEPIFILNIH